MTLPSFTHYPSQYLWLLSLILCAAIVVLLPDGGVF